LQCKYVTDSGWQVYGNASFAKNRKSVTVLLEDGGMGDEDGIENGVIVDPSGIASVESLAADSASLSTGGTSTSDGGGGCFISAGVPDAEMRPFDSISSKALLSLGIILGAGIIFAAAIPAGINK
jgi:hypothetical protein